MTALLQGQTRRLARFGGSVCGATDLKFRWPRACLCPYPPHPPTMETRPHGGQARKDGGRGQRLPAMGDMHTAKNSWISGLNSRKLLSE